MSGTPFVSPTPSSITPLPQFALAVYVGRYYAVAGLALLFYDHITTFDREVARIWTSRFTVASLLFYMNRYGSAVFYMALAVALFDPTWSPNTCQRFIILPAVGSIIAQATISLVMLLRTHALWGRKRVVLAILVVAYIALMSLIVRAFAAGRRFDPEKPIYPGCMLIVPGAISKNPLVHAWLTLMGFDFLIIFLTLWKTISIHRLGGKMPLTALLMRDGVMYFAVICLANFSYFTVYVNAIPVNLTVAHAISAIMTSRLILNLRQESSATTIMGSRSGEESFYSRDEVWTQPQGQITALTSYSANVPSVGFENFATVNLGDELESEVKGGSRRVSFDTRNGSDSQRSSMQRTLTPDSKPLPAPPRPKRSRESIQDFGPTPGPSKLPPPQNSGPSRLIPFFPMGNFGGPLDADEFAADYDGDFNRRKDDDETRERLRSRKGDEKGYAGRIV